MYVYEVLVNKWACFNLIDTASLANLSQIIIYNTFYLLAYLIIFFTPCLLIFFSS